MVNARAHPGVDFPFFRNIFYSYDIQWLTYTSGRAKNVSLFGEGTFWTQKFVPPLFEVTGARVRRPWGRDQ